MRRETGKVRGLVDVGVAGEVSAMHGAMQVTRSGGDVIAWARRKLAREGAWEHALREGGLRWVWTCVELLGPCWLVCLGWPAWPGLPGPRAMLLGLDNGP